jgi:hypothetical protein
MRGIDHRRNSFFDEIAEQPLGAAKTADAAGDIRQNRRFCATRQLQDCVEPLSAGQHARDGRRLARAAQNQNSFPRRHPLQSSRAGGEKK